MILCLTQAWSEHMNKWLVGITAVFVVSLVSLVAVFAYQGNTQQLNPNYNAEVHEQLESAIEAGDYDAWIQIRKDNNLPMNGKMFQVLTKENFVKYTALHNAMQSGDTETANAIKAELGLGNKNMQGKGSSTGCGMQSATNQKTGCMHATQSGTQQRIHTESCPMRQ